MNYEDIKNKFFNAKFIYLFIFTFIILYIFFSFIKFLGQWPMLLIITFFIAYYFNNKNDNNLNYTSLYT
jgi:hypothetical protein